MGIEEDSMHKAHVEIHGQSPVGASYNGCTVSQEIWVGLEMFIPTMPQGDVLCVCESLQGHHAGKRKLFLCAAVGAEPRPEMEVNVRSNFIAEE